MSRLPMLENIDRQPDSLRGILELYQGEQQHALKACARSLQASQGRLIFSGMGASLFASLPAVSRLAEHGFAAQALESAELLHYGAPSLRAGDVGVLVSRSGGSIEVLRLAEKMRTAGMSVIGVTNVPGSELGKMSDLTLLIGSLPDQLIAVQTYTGTLLLLLLLAEEVIAGETEKLSTQCHTALPIFFAFIQQSWQAADSWRELMSGPGALYLLGRGPALASAHEGALLLHETAKSPAVAMSSGQFRHGPVEVVSRDFRAIVFGAPLATRTMDRSLAGDLSTMGATIRWLGPSSEQCDTSHVNVDSLLPWPHFATGADHILARLCEIVPLQIAAYNLALWRGITPGDFRYASEITSAESGFPLFQSRASRV